MSKINPRDYADLVQRPILTEKATRMMELNQFTFDVAPKATKPQIKAAIEELFQVKVVGVNTQNPPRKKRRVGKFAGFKPVYKRAVVTLADGDPIRKILFPEV
ncbi:MAG: 50S ribosomal protein L23 [Richelia sp. CSU_2_1]|nr:50S ribosomal protein L23 [Microcoleus sp. SU_5_6]NJR21803.1 50S ribosomal protein L23 [Richelia sp. CSU_2_1]